MKSVGPFAGGSTPQPSSACHACRPRSRRPFALHCRAGSSRPPEKPAAARKDIGKARCGTPQSAAAALPACGARIALRVLKHTCVLRPLRCREAAKTGAVSEGRSYAFYRRTGDNERSDGRLPSEKQLFRRRRALDSAAPCRGAFQPAVSQKPPLQGEVDAPQGAAGGVHCRLAAEVSCEAGQGLALRSAGGDRRAKSRHFVLCAPKRRLRAAVLASSRKPLRPGAGGGIQPAAPTRPNGGPMKSSAPAQGGQHSTTVIHHICPPGSAARLPYIVGRAFTPARKVCGVARLSSQKILEKNGAGCKIPAGPFVV